MAKFRKPCPARVNAIAAGVTEVASGALLAAGLATPAAAGGITGTMTTAIAKVHARNGLWNHCGGFEYNAVLIAAVGVLAEEPGRLSLDALRGRSRWGTCGPSARWPPARSVRRPMRRVPTPPEGGVHYAQRSWD